MNKKLKKLTLNSETLRHLDASAMKEAAGGLTTVRNSDCTAVCTLCTNQCSECTLVCSLCCE